MRVLHVYHDFWPIRGGIEDYLADLTRAQRDQGIEPIILCANHRSVTRVDQLGRVRVIRAATFGRYYTPFCPSWPHWVRHLQPDRVHLHLPCPLGEWAVWLMRPRKLIVSLHNDYVRPKGALKFHRPLHRALLKRADAIIASPRDCARSSPVLYDLQTKVRIVPYGIDLGKYVAAPALQTPSRLAGEGRLGADILYAGRLCYYKGVEVLLDAAPLIGGHIIIVGDGPWRKKLQAQAQRHQLGEHVSFCGAVSEPALIAQMQSSRVFVFPSTERSEAFGIVQLKAMACGLPVVSTDLLGVSWLNRHGETGLTVPVRDVNALACAVNQLLSDTALHQRLVAGARERASEFDVGRMARETKRVYDAVA